MKKWRSKMKRKHERGRSGRNLYPLFWREKISLELSEAAAWIRRVQGDPEADLFGGLQRKHVRVWSSDGGSHSQRKQWDFGDWKSRSIIVQALDRLPYEGTTALRKNVALFAASTEGYSNQPPNWFISCSVGNVALLPLGSEKPSYFTEAVCTALRDHPYQDLAELRRRVMSDLNSTKPAVEVIL